MQTLHPPDRRPWRRPVEPFVARGTADIWGDLRGITLEWLTSELGDRRLNVFSRQGLDGRSREGVCTMAELSEHVRHPERVAERWYLVEDFVLARRLRLLERLEPYVRPFLPRAVVRPSAALWVGPARSRTGLHADPDGINILCMIQGEKRFLLIPPEDTPLVGRSTRYDGGAWASDINVFAPDATRAWPQFKQARRQTVVVGPGEMLFVPRHWWHAVENLEPTVAVSYRAETVSTALLNVAMPVQFALHHLGLYRRGHCTCHDAQV